MDTFVVRSISCALIKFRYLTITGIIKKLSSARDREHFFIDLLNASFFVLAILTFFSLHLIADTCLSVIVHFLIVYRLYEVFVCQSNVLFLTDIEYRGNISIPDTRRMIAIAIINYCEVILWFTALYFLNADRFDCKFPGASLQSQMGALYFSFVVIATLGFGDITPKDGIGMFLVTCELALGIFFAILIISRYVGSMPSFDPKNPESTTGNKNPSSGI